MLFEATDAMSSPSEPPPKEVSMFGRYSLHTKIASGGTANIYLGRLQGPVGFSRTVAIKRLRWELATDPSFVTMFLDEARLAARVRHANVVPVLDVLTLERELLLVMEYVQGTSLAQLLRPRHDRPPPPEIVSSLICGVLLGLHAAHEAKSEDGHTLSIVHRDVSPQNILVGMDGVARVTDFGIAKASERLQATAAGTVKGKIAYMAPEQVRGEAVDRRADVFATAVVLWEALTGQRLFARSAPGEAIGAVLYQKIPAPSQLRPGLSRDIDRVVARGLERDPSRRFSTAKEMALALERALPGAPIIAVADWLQGWAPDLLARRAHEVAQAESSNQASDAPTAIQETCRPELCSTLALSPPTSAGSHRRRRMLAAITLSIMALATALLGAGLLTRYRSDWETALARATVFAHAPGLHSDGVNKKKSTSRPD